MGKPTVSKQFLNRNDACDEASEWFSEQKTSDPVTLCRNLLFKSPKIGGQTKIDWIIWVISKKLTTEQFKIFSVYLSHKYIDILYREKTLKRKDVIKHAVVQYAAYNDSTRWYNHRFLLKLCNENVAMYPDGIIPRLDMHSWNSFKQCEEVFGDFYVSHPRMFINAIKYATELSKSKKTVEDVFKDYLVYTYLR